MAPPAGVWPVQRRVPDDGMRAYYAQRADAGLILAGFWARKPLRSGGPVAENAP